MVEAKHINVTTPQMNRVLHVRSRAKIEEIFCSCFGNILNSSAMVRMTAKLKINVVNKRLAVTMKDL